MARHVTASDWVQRGDSYWLGTECLEEYLRQQDAMGPVKLSYFLAQTDGRFLAEIYVHAGYFLGVVVPEIEKIEAEYSVVIDMGPQSTLRDAHLRQANNREVTIQLVRRMSASTRIRVGLLVSESVEDATMSEVQTYIAPDEGQMFLKFHSKDD